MTSAGLVEEWNPLAQELFGYSSEYARGQSLGELIVPEPMRPYHEMGLRRYVQTRDPHCIGSVMEVEALHQEGHPVPIHLQILPRDTDGALFFEAHMAAR